MAEVGFWSALLAQRKAQWDGLRDAGRVVEIDGKYHVTRYEDVVAALHNPEVFSSALRPRQSGFELVDLPPIPVMLDPPEHTYYRAVLRPMFSPAVVKDVEPLLSEQAAWWVDRVAANGGCDVIEDVVCPFALAAWQTILGLPAEHGQELHLLKHNAHREPNGSIERLMAVFHLLAYMSSAVAQRRENPNLPGLLAKVTAALSDRDALATAYTMHFAGGANEIPALGHAFLALACDPQLRRVLCSDPTQTKVFVDEILRLESPLAAGIPRVTTREATIGNVTIPAGATVSLSVGAINRESGSNDITVTDGQIQRCPHWTFGAGPHRCPAAGLARMEMTVLINEWLARIPEFEIAPGYSLPDMPERAAHLTPGLPLRWATATAERTTDSQIVSQFAARLPT